ncbi:hypothetical protein ACN6LI_000578, partial [Streptomyces violaceoruber]
MVGHRPSDWHVLDLEKDPTPGDPQRVRTLAKTLHDFADDVSEALRLVPGLLGTASGTLAPTPAPDSRPLQRSRRSRAVRS